MTKLQVPAKIILALLLLTSCKTVGTPSDAFVLSQSAVAKRQIESRTFETGNQQFLIQNIVATLQDFGFDIRESDASSGLVSGAKLQKSDSFFGIHSDVRVTVTVNTFNDKSAIVRVNFQKIRPSHDPRLFKAEPILDGNIYIKFFDRLEQSLFLDRNEK